MGCQLFSLYFNDIVFVSNVLKPLMFADDAAFLHSCSSYDSLISSFNNELLKINLWLVRNRLTLNVEKTVALVFTKRRHDVNLNNKLKIADEYINFNREVKYLGVTIDDDLRFDSHVSNVCNKVSKNIGVLYRMSFYVPNSVLLNAYYALVYPLLTYCNIVWGGAAALHIDKLLFLQKKMVRILTNSEYFAHTEPLFRKTRILKMHDLYSFLCSIAAYKNKDNLSVATHNHDTRNGATYYIPQFQRLKIAPRSTSYILPRKFNEVPICIQSTENLTTFKKLLKNYIVDSYQC